MSDRYLDQLKVGESARIDAIEGDDELSLRLLEMGLIEGERIELIGSAPLGDPLEFRVRGFHLSLRREEARRVAIEPAAS